MIHTVFSWMPLDFTDNIIGKIVIVIHANGHIDHIGFTVYFSRLCILVHPMFLIFALNLTCLRSMWFYDAGCEAHHFETHPVFPVIRMSKNDVRRSGGRLWPSKILNRRPKKSQHGEGGFMVIVSPVRIEWGQREGNEKWSIQ